MGTNVGKSERRQKITYTVHASKNKSFEFEAYKFDKEKVKEECRKRKYPTHVRVTWQVQKRWGFDFNDEYVTWEE